VTTYSPLRMPRLRRGIGCVAVLALGGCLATGCLRMAPKPEHWPCTTDDDCRDGNLCHFDEPGTGECRPSDFCDRATDCSAEFECLASRCTQVVCSSDSELACAPYRCTPATHRCRSECYSDTDCSGNTFCEPSSQRCLPRKSAIGTPCNDGSQCTSGICCPMDLAQSRCSSACVSGLGGLGGDSGLGGRNGVMPAGVGGELSLGGSSNSFAGGSALGGTAGWIQNNGAAGNAAGGAVQAAGAGSAGYAGNPGGGGNTTVPIPMCGPQPACTPGFTCTPSGCSGWASWAMPNPVSTGLPNPANYDTSTAPGVVIDQVTGLWWQRILDTNDGTGANCFGTCTYAGAVSYCQHLTLAGHTDWRVPTRIELVSLVDFTIPTPGPTIDGAAFPGTPGVSFWTSSPNVKAPTYMWHVAFGTGGIHQDANVANQFRIRCVR
jgi:Protein of unknown function (DUF1566)/Dickkopf N-terminal cysteine-rich region